MDVKSLFNELGAVHVKDAVSVELRSFLTNILLRSPDIGYGNISDQQVPSALAAVDHEIVFETLLERLWPTIEQVVGEELLPTYAYARLYTNGNTLKKHTDRPACEVSITIQLGRSHHYAWPIYMGNKRFDLAEGDGVIYKGMDIPHWRDECDGPEDYYSGQVFLHFVRKNGPHAAEANDSTVRSVTKNHFKKFRTFNAEHK